MPVDKEQPDRRRFIKGATCAVGAAMGVVPMVAGVRVALDPLGHEASGSEAEFIRLAELADLENGVPRKFSIVADKTDKWTRYRDVPVGAVYLLKSEPDGETKVTAFNTVCPHLGCFVDYRAEKQDFFCPCHDSKFDVKDGSVQSGVSPRGMDTLEVEIRKGTEIWVKYQRFKANSKDPIVIS